MKEKYISVSKACDELKKMLDNGDFDNLDFNSIVYKAEIEFLINWFRSKLFEKCNMTENEIQELAFNEWHHNENNKVDNFQTGFVAGIKYNNM